MAYANNFQQRQMPNRVKVNGMPDVATFSSLTDGKLFRYVNRQDDCNVYLKAGGTAVMLKCGAIYALIDDPIVAPLPKGAEVTLTVN